MFCYKKIAKAIKDRVTILSEIKEMISFLNKVDEYEPSIYENKKAKTDASVAPKSLNIALNALQGLDDFTNDSIFACLAEAAQVNEMKNITLMYPMQVALSGRTVAAGGATAIAEILGKQETLERITNALEKLG